jgi:hypothetical protein
MTKKTKDEATPYAQLVAAATELGYSYRVYNSGDRKTSSRMTSVVVDLPAVEIGKRRFEDMAIVVYFTEGYVNFRILQIADLRYIKLSDSTGQQHPHVNEGLFCTDKTVSRKIDDAFRDKQWFVGLSLAAVMVTRFNPMNAYAHTKYILDLVACAQCGQSIHDKDTDPDFFGEYGAHWHAACDAMYCKQCWRECRFCDQRTCPKCDVISGSYDEETGEFVCVRCNYFIVEFGACSVCSAPFKGRTDGLLCVNCSAHICKSSACRKYFYPTAGEGHDILCVDCLEMIASDYSNCRSCDGLCGGPQCLYCGRADCSHASMYYCEGKCMAEHRNPVICPECSDERDTLLCPSCNEEEYR